MHLKSHIQKLAVLLTPLAVSACLYGPEHLHIEIESVCAKPHSHTFAVLAKVWHVQDPEGFIAQFPNGGTQKVNAKTAKVFVVNVDTNTVVQSAAMDQTKLVSNPISMRFLGWDQNALYFRLDGYGGYSWRSGDHIDDPRRSFIRVTPSLQIEEIESAPAQLTCEHRLNDHRSPYLSHARTGLQVRIGTDAPLSQSIRTGTFTIDEETGDGRFIESY